MRYLKAVSNIKKAIRQFGFAESGIVSQSEESESITFDNDEIREQFLTEIWEQVKYQQSMNQLCHLRLEYLASSIMSILDQRYYIARVQLGEDGTYYSKDITGNLHQQFQELNIE